jgi:minor extracellular serine protease Vpr
MRAIRQFAFTVLSLILFQQIAFSQSSSIKLSASARLFLWTMENKPIQQYGYPDQYVYMKDAAHTVYINGIVKVKDGFDVNLLRSQGIKTGTIAGNIITLRIPVQGFLNFLQTPGIEYLDMDQPGAPEIDAAVKATRADSVHKGIFLPQAYSGKNVVIGVIDAGFDYTHPAFLDTSGNRLRLVKAWEQKNTNGSSPATFQYGSEFTDSTALYNRYFDITNNTHGTHVAGIASGSGIGSSADNRLHRGLAYESEMVFTAIYPTAEYWLNTGMVDFLDGISYTFEYAQSVGKPAVANLSWGCPLGPRDGSSLFSQACNNLVDEGKIFVVSGGNNGNNSIHLRKQFAANDTVVNTICTFPSTLVQKLNQIDVWGQVGESFKMQFLLYNGNTKLDSTYHISLDDQVHQLFLNGSNGDTCFVTVTTVASEFNGKPHMLVQLFTRNADRLAVRVMAQSGLVDMWQGIVVQTSGHYGQFAKLGYAWAVNGDTEFTCGDLVSTERAIAVAAYNSKNTYVNFNGGNINYTGYGVGNIASFSSKGPTADGRTKPNIAAPGLVLVSSISSVDSGYVSGGGSFTAVQSFYTSPVTGITYPYAGAAGTSMAAPCVSGIVAMMLEANPNLSPEQVMQTFYSTAIKDNFTGTIPTQGSNIWGFGKVNAYRAMTVVTGVAGVTSMANEQPLLIYPNPTSDELYIQLDLKQAEQMDFKLYDLNGRICFQQSYSGTKGINRISFNTRLLNQGLYILEVSGNNTFARARVQLID